MSKNDISDKDNVKWLVERSLLDHANRTARRYAGQGRMWRFPYATARPRAAAERASVWFSAYPASVITRPGESVLKTLGDPALWQAFAAIGIEALHTGPVKQSGGVQRRAPSRPLSTATSTASAWELIRFLARPKSIPR